MAQTNIILTKESNQNEIKSYFSAILELSKSDNEFPINLDEVWMLVYPRKDHAVRSLKENFIEDVDYKVFPKNGEQDWGGNNRVDYHLTVSCLEYFIARKVRPVFEVYRHVFHQAAKAVQKELTRKELLQMALQAEEEKERLQLVNKEQQLTITQQDETIAQQSEVIKEQAIKVEKFDTIYGGVAGYRVSQLAAMFGISSAKALNKILKDLKIQHRVNEQWILNADYQGKGYTAVVTTSHECSDGRKENSALTVWTEPGRVFLHGKLSKAGYIKNINL